MANYTYLVYSLLSSSEISGRACTEDIPAGTVFTQLTSVHSTEADPPEKILTPIAEVHLRLEEVEVFRRRSNVAAGGHLSILFVSGDTTPIQQALGQLAEGHYLQLEASPASGD